ncbi:hypothetical protein ACJW8F_05905 [Plesiomonas shigelloides]
MAGGLVWVSEQTGRRMKRINEEKNTENDEEKGEALKTGRRGSR